MKRMRSKSFFNKVLFYFGLILILPVCTILYLYLYADFMVKERIEISNHNMLNQFSRDMDIILEKMHASAVSMTLNDECQKYAMYATKGNHMGYQSYATKESLEAVNEEGYLDVFVYFPSVDRVVSWNNTSLSKEDYFSLYFDNDGEQFEKDLERILSCESKRPRLYSLSSDNDVPLLCMTVRRHYILDSKQDYIAVVILSPDYLDKLLKKDIYQGAGKFLIYGQEKELIFTNGGEEIALPQGESREFITYEVTMGSESFVMQAEKSQVVAVYYAYQVSRNYYWQQLRNTRILYIFILIGCVIASIVIAYLLCGRIYRPVKAVVDKISRHTNSVYERKQRSEFEYIEELFGWENEQILSLQQEAQSGRDAVLERFIVQLLDGNVTETSSKISEVLREHGMNLCSNQFCVAVIAVEKTEHEDILKFILKNVFCELLDQRHKGYVVSLLGRKYGILINLRESLETEGELKELLETGREFLENQGKIVLSIGMSRVTEGVSQITAAWREAEKALRYRYLYGSGCLVEYAQIEQQERHYHSAKESKLYLMLVGYITEEKLGDISACVEDLFSHYGVNKEVTIEMVDSFLTEVVSAVNSLILSRKYTIPDRTEWLEKLTQASDLSQFRGALEELLTFLREQEQEYTGFENVCTDVKEYIKEHYTDYELSMTTLSEEFGISGIRLSRIFKETYDISILDYVANTRVRAGKKLLESTEKSVAEIAANCGFMSSNVFIRTFKKWEGITPGGYRKLMEDSDKKEL